MSSKKNVAPFCMPLTPLKLKSALMKKADSNPNVQFKELGKQFRKKNQIKKQKKTEY